MQQHDCVKKQCPFLERFADHSYWIQKKKIKDMRIARKQQKAELAHKQKGILKRFREPTEHFDDFAVIGCEFKDGFFWLRCVSLQKVLLHEYVRSVAKEYHIPIKVCFIKNTYEMRKILIDKIRSEYLI